MKVVVAMDSFKGSLSSLDAGEAVRRGVLQADPCAQVQVLPLADGGEGTVEAVTMGLGGTLQKVSVTGPLGQPVMATYGILEDGKTAVLEMSQAAGITLIRPEQRNPLYTTTYGVGEMIRDAIHKGCREFLVGIGGSATNDGGCGMLKALGYEFLQENGKEIADGGAGLEKLHHICCEHVLPELRECSFQIACDVTNPLCGTLGCSAVFGPQKGATSEMIAQMDGWLAKYAGLAKEISEKADDTYPGTGAAGGLGFAFLAFTNAVLRPGIQMVLDAVNLREAAKDCDIVITGEGRLDGQSAMGKAPVGVAKLAKEYGAKVLAFAGCVTGDAKECNARGIDAYFPILREVETLEEAMKPEKAARNLEDTVYQVFRLLKMNS